MLLTWVSLLATHVHAFPAYGSLAGLSERHLYNVMPTLSAKAVLPKPPGPLKFNGTKLVHDKHHPFKAAKKGDLRGPCPGLNTLASHGVSSLYYFTR